MLLGYSFVTQALLGTLFTWGVTALGAGLVYFLDTANAARNRAMLDAMLGFAAGVMLAASYWSLLAPAIEASEAAWGESLSFVPAAVGFGAGGAAMCGIDAVLPWLGLASAEDELLAAAAGGKGHSAVGDTAASRAEARRGWRRMMLLVIAITVHNFPEGLAVGVAFGGQDPSRELLLAAAPEPPTDAGAAGAAAPASSRYTTFESARSVAIGIGLQNFPEGLAVSMPLRRQGVPLWKCFWYGQLSGMVEPLGGLLGAWAVRAVEPLLPYALAFAAGAMVFVVVDELVPEAAESGNKRLSTLGVMVGFILMMSMDVGLG